MSYILTRPPSPRTGDHHHHQDEDSLVTALNHALQSFSHRDSQPSSLSHTLNDHDMHNKQDKPAPSLDIVVNSDTLTLRGTGVDVDPALLSGNVVLHLTEPTSIKEITLQFRGKARLPVSASEPLSLSSSQLTYLVCNHEWSFLEGNRSHAHTLKAGRHLFPFQLQIGGSLPSTILTSALGGASVQYKLRATAVRPGFGITHRDLAATCPITILRGFGQEALEYQQTLEIENTWPEKLMYSIMIPHKAWAAGEKVTAVVKFSPLVKGARVLNVTTTINETIKLYSRAGTQESTRVISSTRHDIADGQAVCVDEQHHRYRIPLLHHGSSHVTHRASQSVASQPASPLNGHSHHSATPNANTGTYFPSPTAHSHPPSPLHHTTELAPLTTTTTNSSQSSVRPSGPASADGTGALSQPGSSSNESLAQPITPPPVIDPSEAELIEPSVDVVTTLHITVPMHATPSHSLEPVQVSHRIRWSILIGNSDGHTSELRCSLPLHVLDYRLYDEARAATLHTRRILLGPQDVDGGTAVGTNGEDAAEEDNDLPSYPAHVRDRVANAYIPDGAVMRVVNPWVMQGVSPTLVLPGTGPGTGTSTGTGTGTGSAQAHSESSSGVQSPAAFETWVAGTHSAPGGAGPNARNHRHLPHDPTPGAAPLEWVNTELLLSLHREAPEVPVPLAPARVTPPSRTPPESPAERSGHGSRVPSRRGSRANSRANSRAASPERERERAGSLVSSASAPETFVHSHSTASRNMHSLFHIAMKPFTSLSNTFSLGSRSPSHTNLHAHAQHPPHAHSYHGSSHAHSQSQSAVPSASASSVNLASLAHAHASQSQSLSPSVSQSQSQSPSSSHPQTPQPMTTLEQLHYAFTEVPDYDMASRGFLGGGITPLSSLSGLPNYEDAVAGRGGGGGDRPPERSFSDTDLAGMFAAAQRGAHRRPQRAGQGVPPIPRTAASTPPPTAPASAAVNAP